MSLLTQFEKQLVVENSKEKEKNLYLNCQCPHSPKTGHLLEVHISHAYMIKPGTFTYLFRAGVGLSFPRTC